jgi:transcription antitermination factor NusG
MPILQDEVDCFPHDLLTGFAAEPGERRWWALQTRARQEKSVARELLQHEAPHFLPKLCKKVMYRGRPRQSFVPMFAGYVFLFGTEDERVKALATNRVATVVPVLDQGRLYHDLTQVQRVVASRTPLEIEKWLTPGRRVRVRHGSFQGLEGVILAHRGESRLVIAVNFLGQGVSMEVDEMLLEAAE